MIEIRPLQTLDELRLCEVLQKTIWGFEDISVVPHHLILTTIKNGGLLLGAFEPSAGEERLVGFVYGFPGIENGKLKHCSLMCAVLPERRFQGLGYELKCKQRECVLAQGIELITWTFDPLVSPNANFNLHKLGVISQSYEHDLYGNMRDRLNAGLETDRLTVEWWVASARVRSRVEQKEPSQPGRVNAVPVNRTEWCGDLLVNRGYSLTHNEPRLLLEIPYRWHEMRERDIELVKRWRQETREIFDCYFAQGYCASDFFVVERAEQQRAFYLLTRATKRELLERRQFGG